MGRIQVLDFETANLIAAGEVVDRPASVMKELMENAVDAGARHITAEIRRGGVALLSVTDDGCGMSPEDLPVALRRHATSKIKTGADLSAIETLGFRGEALAAIASVSRLSILSRPHDREMGTLLEAEAGRVTNLTEVGCAEGTTVTVEELFYNVPARRKFLKKDATETLAVLAISEKIALSRPDIAISFVADGNLRFATAGDGNLRNALYAVLGRDFAQKLLPVTGEGFGISLSGFVGRSDNTRNNRNFQNVFINGRYVKSRTVMAALEQAYTSYIAPEKFPVCALFLTIAPNTVDVNVHPAKLEVKFTDERVIFETVYYAVRAALESAAFRPELSLAKEPKRTDPLHSFLPIGEEKKEQLRFGNGSLAPKKEESLAPSPKEPLKPAAEARLPLQRSEPSKPQVTANRPYLTPDESRAILEVYAAKGREASQSNTLRSAPILEQKKDSLPLSDLPSVSAAASAMEERMSPKTQLPPYRLLGEAFSCYLLVETEGKLLLIDKHAAHERILFEELLEEQRKGGSLPSQELLLPLPIPLSKEELAAARDCRSELLSVGFAYTVTENLSRAELTAIPMSLDTEAAAALFSEMANALYTGEGDPQVTMEKRRERSLYQVACKAAIKGGRIYDEAHLIWLVERLLALPDITVCPHGRPVAMILSKDELDHSFDRIK